MFSWPTTVISLMFVGVPVHQNMCNVIALTNFASLQETLGVAGEGGG